VRLRASEWTKQETTVTKELWKASTEALLDLLKSLGAYRAWLVRDSDSGRLKASHPALQPLADTVAADTRDYREHDACFFEVGAESNYLLGAFIHRTCRGQAAGGVRFWSYDSVRDYIRDGLRLARGMGQKNALAGLWWGGGKGVIARRPGQDHRDPDLRRAVYQDYGRFMSGLCGCYVTAEDAGTTPPDMAHVFSKTRHTSCIPPAYGGSGNPSVLTGTGVVVAMEAALEHLGMGTLEGKAIAMQGLGNVSYYMIGDLLNRGVASVVGTDIDLAAVQRVKDSFPLVDARVVAPGDVSVFEQHCDVFAPNAVGATINSTTIPVLNARIVCGAANNQLEDASRDAALLRERGILYVPDFLANRMGIVNCANEQYGVFVGDSAVTAHLQRDTPYGIFRRCHEVCERAERSGNTTAAEAELLADELSLELHPIWGNRAREIVDYLVTNDWAAGQPLANDAAAGQTP
jgi:glutamate dehydrogenase/leucine dehydrogenase